MSCFYHLQCTVSIGSYCSLSAARLSRYTSAYSPVVRYCLESSRHRCRKTKMKMVKMRCCLVGRLGRNRVLDVNAHSHHLANPMDCSVCPLQRCSLLQPGLRTDSTDFPDCLTILLSISILYFLVFLFFYYFSFWFHVVD